MYIFHSKRVNRIKCEYIKYLTGGPKLRRSDITEYSYSSGYVDAYDLHAKDKDEYEFYMRHVSRILKTSYVSKDIYREVYLKGFVAYERYRKVDSKEINKLKQKLMKEKKRQNERTNTN